MSKPTVSIVMASRNEIPMLAMSVLSAVEALKADGLDGEVVVVDNSDPEFHEAVKACLQGQTKYKKLRIIHQESPSIAMATDTAHREATGDLLFYMDAHCLIGAGTLGHMVNFFQRHENEPIGFLHAPIQWAHLSDTTRQTHFCVERTQLGEFSGSKAVTQERKVTWKGMPHMIRRSVFLDMNGLGCCAEHKLSRGIMRYFGMKPWLYGYENWAIPDGVVYHFGEWPEKARKFTSYRTYSNSGCETAGTAMGVAAYVYGGENFFRQEWDVGGISKYLHDYDKALANVKRIGGAEREWMLANQKVSLEELFANKPWDS